MTTNEIAELFAKRPSPEARLIRKGLKLPLGENVYLGGPKEEYSWEQPKRTEAWMPDGVFAVRYKGGDGVQIPTWFFKDEIVVNGDTHTLVYLHANYEWSRLDDCKTWHKFEREVES